MKKKELVLNPYFIVGLILLLLNDFYFKYEYGNWITGKLSDFAGLFIFPLFVAFLFPRSGKYISLVTGIGFIVWKLPLMTLFIDWINTAQSLFTIDRTIDYSIRADQLYWRLEGKTDYYQTDSIIIREPDSTPDTIVNVKYQLRKINPEKTEIRIINATIRPRYGNTQDWKHLRNLKRIYKRDIKKHLVKKID